MMCGPSGSGLRCASDLAFCGLGFCNIVRLSKVGTRDRLRARCARMGELLMRRTTPAINEEGGAPKGAVSKPPPRTLLLRKQRGSARFKRKRARLSALH